MSREKQNAEIYKSMCEELFNNLEKQYQEVFKVKAESEQIEEMAKVLERVCEKTVCSDYHMNCELCQATRLHDAGYRKQSEVIRCKDCNYFMEYSSEYSRTTENADGDCHIRLMNSENRQFCACRHDDFCSFAKMKGSAEWQENLI